MTWSAGDSIGGEIRGESRRNDDDAANAAEHQILFELAPVTAMATSK